MFFAKKRCCVDWNLNQRNFVWMVHVLFAHLWRRILQARSPLHLGARTAQKDTPMTSNSPDCQVPLSLDPLLHWTQAPGSARGLEPDSDRIEAVAGICTAGIAGALEIPKSYKERPMPRNAPLLLTTKGPLNPLDPHMLWKELLLNAERFVYTPGGGDLREVDINTARNSWLTWLFCFQRHGEEKIGENTLLGSRAVLSVSGCFIQFLCSWLANFATLKIRPPTQMLSKATPCNKTNPDLNWIWSTCPSRCPSSGSLIRSFETRREQLRAEYHSIALRGGAAATGLVPTRDPDILLGIAVRMSQIFLEATPDDFVFGPPKH